MIFYEKIGLARIFSLWFSRKESFYWRRGLILYFLESAAPKTFVHLKKRCKKLDYGFVEAATNVKKSAHLNAQGFIEKMALNRFSDENARLFGIDFATILKIFTFSEVVYPKFEFFELAIKYAIEHPAEKHVFYVEVKSLGEYYNRLKDAGIVRDSDNHNKQSFVFSILLAPFLLWWYWRSKGQKKHIEYKNSIICNCPKPPIYESFRELFGDQPQTKYAISQPYVARHHPDELSQMKINYLGLSAKGYIFLKQRVFKYILLCFQCFSQLSGFGSNLLRLFNDIILGRAEAPHGQGNLFITYEHFYASRAIRNEFIRQERSKSVFLPLTQYISPKYYFTEFGYNYDIVCSSGKHLEESYAVNQASSKIFLKTGGYATHRGTKKPANYQERISKLNAFKGDFIAITILSCGLVDMSRNIENKLMSLAKRLAGQAGIKVFIRLKSRYEMPYDDKFYSPFAENEPSIMLTSQEYELWDFLPVTDLFITDISNSGCDMVMTGGQVMFVDFLQAPDFFLFWEKIPGARISGDNAFNEIIRWIKDGQNGAIRIGRRAAMEQVRDYIGYTFASFDSYKENLIAQLKQYWPTA